MSKTSLSCHNNSSQRCRTITSHLSHVGSSYRELTFYTEKKHFFNISKILQNACQQVFSLNASKCSKYIYIVSSMTATKAEISYKLYDVSFIFCSASKYTVCSNFLKMSSLEGNIEACLQSDIYNSPLFTVFVLCP